MLGPAVWLSVVVMLAGAVGFGVSGPAAEVARLLCYFSLIVLMVIGIAWAIGRPPL